MTKSSRNKGVLEVYKRPYNAQRPVVCFDETSKQFVREIQQPLVASPGQVERFDYEYERNGVGNLFMFFEPLAGWRHVETTERRTCDSKNTAVNFDSSLKIP